MQPSEAAPPAASVSQSTAAAEPPIALRMLNSTDLFGEAREIVIAHRGALYRLRMTQQNRLILQK